VRRTEEILTQIKSHSIRWNHAPPGMPGFMPISGQLEKSVWQIAVRPKSLLLDERQWPAERHAKAKHMVPR